MLQLNDTCTNKILLELFEKSGSVLFQWKNNENWDVVYVSSSVKNLSGYLSEDFLAGAIRYRELIYFEDLARVEHEVIHSLQQKKSYFQVVPFRIITKNKTIKWVKKNILILKNSMNKVEYFIGYIEDMTKVINQKILSQKQKFFAHNNKVLEVLNEIQLLMLKENSLKNHEAIFKNFLILLQVERIHIFQNYKKKKKYFTSQIFEYALDKNIAQIDNRELQDISYDFNGYKRWFDILSNNQIISGDVDSFPKPEQSILKEQGIVSLLVVPIIIENDFWGFIGIDDCKTSRIWNDFEKNILLTFSNSYVNILQRMEYTIKLEKKVKKQIKNLQRRDAIILEQSKMAAMGEMIGNIAHQWRQPLNAIGAINFAIETQLDFGKKLNADMYKPYSIQIDNQLNFMSQTIDDFRDFFSPKRDKYEFLPKNAIENVLHLLESLFKSEEIHIKKDFNIKSLFKGYQNELEQVVLNVLNNSKDALIEKQIPIKEIVIRTYEKTSKLVIEIIDNGGGISEDTLNKVFEPYFTTKFKSQGTGIGLYMSKIIIEEHMKGSIKIKNYKDGAKTIIKLPKTQI